MGTLPAPPSLPSGHVVTGADLRTVADAVSFLLGASTGAYGQRPLAVMRQTVAQSIANAATTAVLLDAEDVDRDGGHSTTANTSRYTANTAGWYLVSTTAGTVPTASTGRTQITLRVNGATEYGGTFMPNNTAYPAAASVTSVVFLNVGDYVETMVYQNSGSSANTFLGNGIGRMSITWQGE